LVFSCGSLKQHWPVRVP
jgi:phage tail sheath gpL-like